MQLLRNLVVNAIKYGKPGTPVHIVLKPEDGTVVMEVANQGATIEQSALDGLFEPLKRASQHESKWNDTSMGLGLFIAREIALAHGGSIQPTSQDERTTFTVRLPQNAPEPS